MRIAQRSWKYLMVAVACLMAYPMGVHGENLNAMGSCSITHTAMGKSRKRRVANRTSWGDCKGMANNHAELQKAALYLLWKNRGAHKKLCTGIQVSYHAAMSTQSFSGSKSVKLPLQNQKFHFNAIGGGCIKRYVCIGKGWKVKGSKCVKTIGQGRIKRQISKNATVIWKVVKRAG